MASQSTTRVVALDIPAWLLKAFERLDYDGMNILVRMGMLAKLRDFCGSFPQKTGTYSWYYQSIDVTQEVCDILNVIDYARISASELERMKHDVPNYLSTYLSQYMKAS